MTPLVIALVIAGLSGAGWSAQARGGKTATVIARAGSVVVTDHELLVAMRQERTSGEILRIANASNLEGVEALARALLERKLLAAYARAEELDREPDVHRAITEATERILALAVAERARDAVDDSDPALRRFYTAHADTFRSASRRKTRHIVVATQDEAERARARVLSGEDFAAVAREVNVDTTRDTGGELGWVARGVMVKSFEAAVFALDAGAVSEPVQTSFGWHVVKIEEVDPGTLPPFELIRDRVLEAAQDAAVERVKTHLWHGNPAVIDRAALGALLK